MSGIKLRTENLTVGYSGRALIGDITLSLHQGQIMTLIGPNGAGKSTILKSVIRQLALVGGAVYLNGRDMAPMPEREVARRLSVLMTGHIHPELMTCFDVAATGRYPYTGRLGILSREDREKVSQCLELVHASGLAEQDFSRISDGQRQRVLLARALCAAGRLLILDEPITGLDPAAAQDLYKTLSYLNEKEGMAVVMVTHDLRPALRQARTVLHIGRGNFFYGTAEAYLRSPQGRRFQEAEP